MRRIHAAWAMALFALACQSRLELPEKPLPPTAPGPGSISGRLVLAEAGTTRTKPAQGARIQVLRSNVAAVSNAEGRFVLEPITHADGTILIQFDSDDDGTFDRQRLLAFAEISAAPGRDVSIG